MLLSGVVRYHGSKPFTYGLCAQADPRVFPGYGGVKMSLSDSYTAVRSVRPQFQRGDSQRVVHGPLLQLPIRG
jgi:hypothetical protein